jgi:hypothetical protein
MLGACAMLSAMASPRHAHTYDVLSAESFAQLDDRELEVLVRECVHSELTQRRIAEFELKGPPPANVGGFDLRSVIRTVPGRTREEFQYENRATPLTFDEVGETVVYSAKSGETWRKHALDEAKTGSAWAVDALANGGRLVVVLSHVDHDAPTPVPKRAQKAKKATKKSTAKPVAPKKPRLPFNRELANAYLKRLRETNASAPDPIDRIHVFDANHFRDYLRNVRPAISKPLLGKLGIAPIPGLLDVDEWLLHHEQDRPPSPRNFVWDGERRTKGWELVDTLQRPGNSQYGRAVWIVSPPGVGKTRFVAETLRTLAKDETLASRTYVAIRPAVDVLQDFDWLGNFRDSILVVDDCAEHDAENVYKAFGRTNKDGRGGLILITALAHPSQVPTGLPWLELKPMDETSCEALVRQELGEDYPDAAAIANLTEGYPWFTVLVSQEVAASEEKRAPLTVAKAAELALAPRSENSKREVERRVAALFIVMLTEGEVLDKFNKGEKQELLDLFDSQFTSWKDLSDTIKACAERGLLRPGDGGMFRYVTPAILEREVAKRVLAPPPDPGGGVPFQDRIQSDRMRIRLQALVSRLEKLGFPIATLSDLALPVVARLEASPSTLESLGRVHVTGTELLFAARHQPARLAATLRRFVEATSTSDLRSEREWRRSVMFALASVAGRRSSFEDAEAALFRLACAENESYANNATATWAELFDVFVNTTYRTFAEKLPLLEARIRDANASCRLVALAALARLTSEHGFKLAGAALEGPYPQETVAESYEARLIAWRLLLERVDDTDGNVRPAAASIVVQHLRAAVRTGVFPPIGALLLHASRRLTDLETRRLRKAVEDVDRYDQRFLTTPDGQRLWAQLREGIAPHSFAERLHQEVGTHGHAASLKEQEERDQQLARQGLGESAPIRRELDWLASPEAVRAVPFGHALGTVDHAEALLDPLLSMAGRSPDLVSAYLSGRQDAGCDASVDGAIARLRAGGHWDAAALSVWRAGATPLRIERLCDDVEKGRVSERALRMFAWASWHKSLAESEIERFAKVLLARGTATAAGLALDILEQRTKVARERERFGALLLAAFERASLDDSEAQLAYIWEQAAKRLIEDGRADRVAQIAVAAASRVSDHLVRPEVIAILAQCAMRNGPAVWEAIRPSLESDDSRRHAFVHACKDAGIPVHVPVSVLEAWVGANVDRASLIASMTPMHTGFALSPIARALILRFGAHSQPVTILLADLDTTPRAVASLAQFADEQLTRVRGWQKDLDPAVREFADLAAAHLSGSRDQYAADEEYRRRRWGT